MYFLNGGEGEEIEIQEIICPPPDTTVNHIHVFHNSHFCPTLHRYIYPLYPCNVSCRKTDFFLLNVQCVSDFTQIMPLFKPFSIAFICQLIPEFFSPCSTRTKNVLSLFLSHTLFPSCLESRYEQQQLISKLGSRSKCNNENECLQFNFPLSSMSSCHLPSACHQIQQQQQHVSWAFSFLSSSSPRRLLLLLLGLLTLLGEPQQQQQHGSAFVEARASPTKRRSSHYHQDEGGRLDFHRLVSKRPGT